jgi:hypothetical protein
MFKSQNEAKRHTEIGKHGTIKGTRISEKKPGHYLKKNSK